MLKKTLELNLKLVNDREELHHTKLAKNIAKKTEKVLGELIDKKRSLFWCSGRE